MNIGACPADQVGVLRVFKHATLNHKIQCGHDST